MSTLTGSAPWGDSGWGQVTTFDAGTWSALSPVAPSSYFLSVSCPTTTFCAAVDTSGAIATYNGTAWTLGPVAATGGQGLESVSCPTAHLCIAGSFNGDIFSFANGA